MVAVPFVIIALVMVFLFFRSRQQVSAAREWPTATGRVLFATVESRRGRSGRSGYSTSYYPNVIYEYTVNGQRYQGNRLTFGTQVGRGSYNTVQRQVDSYSVGGSIQVYYNPDNPAEAVLEKTAPAGKIYLFVAALIIAILACTLVPLIGGMNFVNQFLSKLPR
jgi:hypothetical protein